MLYYTQNDLEGFQVSDFRKDAPDTRNLTPQIQFSPYV